MPENEETWELWQAAHTQWIMGPAGPVAIAWTGLRSAAAVLHIAWTPCLLAGLRALEVWSLEQLQKNDRPEPQHHGTG